MPGKNFSRIISLVLACVAAIISSARAADRPAVQELREETWALMTPLPLFAYVVRPVGGGPYPLLIMNHGISGDPEQRGFFPLVEFRDAAFWFARRGYFVVAPVRYGGVSIERPEQGLFSLYFASVGDCDNPNFRWPGLMIATLDKWVIDFMEKEATVAPGKAIVVGQSGGGWGAIALSSLNPPSVRAIITFAAGRGGRVDGKPNNNCAPDKLVEATRNFGMKSRIPMLWIYSENDTYFGPDLANRMHEAFTAAGGKAEFQMLPPFGSDGHFLIDAADAVPIWSPLVSRFLDQHQ
jgi:dienelactone hydrolase